MSQINNRSAEGLTQRIAALTAGLADLSDYVRVVTRGDQDSRGAAIENQDSTKAIEFLTENGFAIVRPWEAHGATSPEDENFRFLVRDPLDTEREVSVEIEERLCADTMFSTRGTVPRSSSFWICCAERHLANHLWEHNAIPDDGKLIVDCLDCDEAMLAISWERSE